MTEADTAIERLIRERIRATPIPDHGLVGEEYGDRGRDAAVRWYIDPIDGTHNFIRGVPLFGTLLAVEVDGEIQVGGDVGARRSASAGMRRGVAGRGPRTATACGGVMRVEAWTRLDDAQLIYGVRARDRRRRASCPASTRSSTAAWRERGFGDFWGYALVAEGAAEAMFEAGMHSLGRGRAAGHRRGGRRPGRPTSTAGGASTARRSSPPTDSSTRRSWRRLVEA